jgi:hypothetical protein
MSPDNISPKRKREKKIIGTDRTKRIMVFRIRFNFIGLIGFTYSL